MLLMSSMFCCRYSKNYNIKMSIEEVVIMNKVFFFHQVMGVTWIK